MHIVTIITERWLDMLLLIFLYLLLRTFFNVSTSVVQRTKRGALNLPTRAGLTLFILFVLSYQGYWQIFGHLHPRLYQLQSVYDPRHSEDTRGILRGTICDRNGTPMAYTDPESYERHYPCGQALAHMIGYIHPVFGRSGLESVFNNLLDGRALGSLQEVKTFLRNGFFREVLKGNDLLTTIDAELQKSIYDNLYPRRGAVIVLNPRNGDILAIVSSPSFNPELITPERFRLLRQNPDSPFLNRTIQGLYPPGSTFKVFTAACALEESQNLTFNCPAEGFLPPDTNRWIRDHEYYEYRRQGKSWPGYRNMGLEYALVRSSNVYFAQLGVQLGPDLFMKYIPKTGFNRQFSLVGHSLIQDAFLVQQSYITVEPSTADAFMALMAMGQGKISVRPFHMAVLYSIIANNGVMQKPHILPETEKGLLEITLSKDTCGFLKRALYNVVEKGTGRSVKIPGLRIAGKTGTADNPHGAPHSWFISFAPADDPTILAAVIVENAGAGAGAAGSLSKTIYLKAVELGYLNLAGTPGKPSEDLEKDQPSIPAHPTGAIE